MPDDPTTLREHLEAIRDEFYTLNTFESETQAALTRIEQRVDAALLILDEARHERRGWIPPYIAIPDPYLEGKPAEAS